MSPSRRKTANVGLIFMHSMAYYRRALRGVWRYAEGAPDWELTSLAPESLSSRIPRRYQPDGLIVTANTRMLDESLEFWRRPLVNVSAVITGQQFARVGVDNEQIGRLAAAHFLERGLSRFAFVGPYKQMFSIERESAYRQAVEASGYDVASYLSRSAREFDPLGLHWDLEPDVQKWLSQLPLPVGIFTPNDLWGIQVIMAARRVNLRVPEDVAVLGVDDDDLYCEMTRPRLSSIIVPAEQIGYEAAALLAQLLEGKASPKEPLLLSPVGIEIRRSTEVLAIDDTDVIAAVRFIRENAHRPLQVADVLSQVPLGRRTLERRCRKFLGWGIGQEIERTHLDRAKKLLANTTLSLQAVAYQSGFQDYRQMARVFRRRLDITAGDYREMICNPNEHETNLATFQSS
jgi:LacI family transcriptional regulator